MALIEALRGIFQKSTKGEVCLEILEFLGPVCFAFLVGLIIGWVWKPKWAILGRHKSRCEVSKSLNLSSPFSSSSSSSPSSPSGFSPLKAFGSAPCLRSDKIWVINNGVHKKSVPAVPIEHDDFSTSQSHEGHPSVITEEDLHNLRRLVEMKDGGPSWIHLMDRSTPSVSYQAWQRDPKTGPPQYRTRTVFEDATPELVRDFYWDDEFRLKWDDMLVHSATIEVCPITGTMIVHWIRKFPFFFGDREYIIGRRMWEFEGSYYCVTKGIPWPSIPRHEKPRRVDLYYSSWYIRAVESRRGNGQLTACEVLLFHHEDMGIPREIAKLGLRQGMWGFVKQMEPGLHAYQKERASGSPLSKSAFMAQINTKIFPEYLRTLESNSDPSKTKEDAPTTLENPFAKNIAKILILGGAIVLAFGLDRGLLCNAFMFRLGRRLGNREKKL
ncbi:hypothetical protein SLA2020_219420 [Shorea laevis]